jgi:rRNA processing protein Krr1/Pno1
MLKIQNLAMQTDVYICGTHISVEGKRQNNVICQMVINAMKKGRMEDRQPGGKRRFIKRCYLSKEVSSVLQSYLEEKHSSQREQQVQKS